MEIRASNGLTSPFSGHKNIHTWRYRLWMESIQPWRHGEDTTRVSSRLIEFGYTDTPDGRRWWTGTRGGTYVAWPSREAALQAFSRPWGAD